MSELEHLDAELDEVSLRWTRALSWVTGCSLGPRAHGVPEPEATAIERLAGRIEEVGPDAAWDEYRTYDGSEPVAFVLSENVKRRSLNNAQLTAIAVDALPALEEEARKRQGGSGRFGSESPDTEPNTRKPNRSYREAAEKVGGTSEAQVGRAKRIKKALPEEFERLGGEW